MEADELGVDELAVRFGRYLNYTAFNLIEKGVMSSSSLGETHCRAPTGCRNGVRTVVVSIPAFDVGQLVRRGPKACAKIWSADNESSSLRRWALMGRLDLSIVDNA